MFENGITPQWLRRAAWSVYSFFGLFALLALGYVWYAAAGGAVFKALIGAGCAIGSIGLGVGMHCIVQLAAVVAGHVRAVEMLTRRAEAAESLLEALQPESSFLAAPNRASTLVAGNVGSAGYPRLVSHGESDAPPSVEDSAIDPGALFEPNPVNRHGCDLSGGELRAVFRESVFSNDFSSALEVGQAIVASFPESEMASQFQSLRPALERRACALAGQTRKSFSR